MSLPTLCEFLDDVNLNRCWINHPNYNLYLRKGFYLIDGKVEEKTIQIANIESKNPGKGFFLKLILEIKNRCLPLPIIVENVLDNRFKIHLIKIGFIKIEDLYRPQTENEPISFVLY